VNFGRILNHANVRTLVSGIAEFADCVGAICEQALFVSRIDPSSGDYSRTVAWAYFVFVSIDQRIERRSIHQPLLDQQGFERFDSQRDVRWNVLVNVIFGVSMISHGRRPCGGGGRTPRNRVWS
jgi:hypothetical protein